MCKEQWRAEVSRSQKARHTQEVLSFLQKHKHVGEVSEWQAEGTGNIKGTSSFNVWSRTLTPDVHSHWRWTRTRLLMNAKQGFGTWDGDRRSCKKPFIVDMCTSCVQRRDQSFKYLRQLVTLCLWTTRVST